MFNKHCLHFTTQIRSLFLHHGLEKIEKTIGESVPTCLKTFLLACGYSSFSSILHISHESICDIEHHMETHVKTCPEVLQTLDCCYSEVYKSQTYFKLMPGHKDFLLSLGEYAVGVAQKGGPTVKQNSFLPIILQEMVRTSQQNVESEEHHALYSDLIRYFSTYTFLLSGHSCYEFLKRNLDLPSTKTVCKYQICRLIFFPDIISDKYFISDMFQ